MANKIEENYNLLQKEINDITKNIHKVQNKNHKTMSTIVEKLKYIEKDIKPLEENGLSNDNLFLFTKMNQTEFIQNNGKNIQNLKINNYLRTYNNNISSRFWHRTYKNNNYKKYQPVIQLYKNYKINSKSNINFNSPPNKKYNNTIDNCITIAKDKFFINKARSNIKEEKDFNNVFYKDSFCIGKKYNNYNKFGKRYSKTIDFNINNNKTIQTDSNAYQKKIKFQEMINFNNNIKNNLNIHPKNKFREYFWNNECDKFNDSMNKTEKDKIKNNIFFGKNNQSMKNIKKIKMNSFKQKSDSSFTKISKKSKSNGLTSMNLKNRNIKTYNKINDLNFNYAYNKNIDKITQLLNCNNYEECLNKINEISEQKKFVNKILKIYNKYNQEVEKGDTDYENILLWINYLIYSKQRNKNDDKYEIFCKQLMKENNINNFSFFQNFTRNIINEKKNENNFLEDIKKILSVEDCFIKENNNNFIKKKDDQYN